MWVSFNSKPEAMYRRLSINQHSVLVNRESAIVLFIIVNTSKNCGLIKIGGPIFKQGKRQHITMEDLFACSFAYLYSGAIMSQYL